MKLLFVTHWANNMLIFRTWMLQEAVRRGHEVLVLCPPDAEAARFSELGVRHIPWALRRGGGAFNMLSAIVEARRILKRERPDATVVYCVQPIMALLWAWKLGGRSGKLYPTFTGLGSLWTDMEKPSWKKRCVRRGVERAFGWLLPMAEQVSVQNKDDLHTVAAWNRKDLSCKLTISLGEGVDKGRFCVPDALCRHSARLRWEIPDDVLVVGFVGRLIREKGALDFLALSKIISERTADGKEIHFLVVGGVDYGNPTCLNELQIKELFGIANMHYVEWIADVWQAYAVMDILVFPSYREGQGLVPIEAMSMGVPAVGYDVIGVKDVIPKDWRVPMGAYKQMAHRALQVLADKENAFNRCLKIAERYNRVIIQTSQLNVYCGLLDG